MPEIKNAIAEQPLGNKLLFWETTNVNFFQEFSEQWFTPHPQLQTIINSDSYKLAKWGKELAPASVWRMNHAQCSINLTFSLPNRRTNYELQVRNTTHGLGVGIINTYDLNQEVNRINSIIVTLKQDWSKFFETLKEEQIDNDPLWSWSGSRTAYKLLKNYMEVQGTPIQGWEQLSHDKYCLFWTAALPGLPITLRSQKLEKLYAYDINSAYPSALLYDNMPYGMPMRIDWMDLDTLSTLVNKFVFFADVIVKAPESLYPFYPLITRTNSISRGNIDPSDQSISYTLGTGVWRGMYLLKELLFLKKVANYDFSIINLYMFNTIPVNVHASLEKYIHLCYSKRSLSLLHKDYFRFRLNALYGKSISRPDSVYYTSYLAWDNQQKAWNAKLVTKPNLVFSDLKPAMHYSPLGATIASEIRLRLYSLINFSTTPITPNFHFIDTDCIALAHPMDKKLLGRNIGQWKNVLANNKWTPETDQQYYGKGIVLAPKVYYISNGEKTIAKYAGEKERKLLTYEHYDQLIQNGFTQSVESLHSQFSYKIDGLFFHTFFNMKALSYPNFIHRIKAESLLFECTNSQLVPSHLETIITTDVTKRLPIVNSKIWNYCRYINNWRVCLKDYVDILWTEKLVLFLSLEDGIFKERKSQVNKVNYILSRPYGITLSSKEIQTINDSIVATIPNITKEWLENQKLVHKDMIQIVQTIWQWPITKQS